MPRHVGFDRVSLEARKKQDMHQVEDSSEKLRGKMHLSKHLSP